MLDLRTLRRIAADPARHFSEVGDALREVRTAELWRESATTFDAWCQEFLSITGRRANQLIVGADVWHRVAICSPNCSREFFLEAHARELSRLPVDGQADGWKLAEALANGARVTAETVARAVDQKIEAEAAGALAAEMRKVETDHGSGSAPAHWWTCPVCGSEYNARSVTAQGWEERCGACVAEGATIPLEPLALKWREPRDLANAREVARDLIVQRPVELLRVWPTDMRVAICEAARELAAVCERESRAA
jgi:hypothetical protein